MYGNRMNNPFMMPNMSYSPFINGAPMIRSAPLMNNTMMTAPMRNGLGSLLGGRPTGGIGSLFSGIKSLNFSNILNNTSKALGVVKEAIPIVKEVGPMVGNMKQMLKIASIFKDETDTKVTSSTQVQKENTKDNSNDTKKSDTIINSTTTNYESNNYEPNFFL